MTDALMVGLLSLGGTLIGSGGAVLAANRLTNWRIVQLEKKMDKHNCLIERMTVVETNMKSIQYEITELREQ